MKGKMKVLQVNVVYGVGSTGQVTATLHRGLLAHGIDAKVYYGRTSDGRDKGVTRIVPDWICKIQSLRSRITGYAYAGCYIGTRKLIRAMEAEKPDVVHLQCINGYFINIYEILDYLKRNQIKTVLTLHAEFMYTANCGHAFECEGWKNGCGLCDRKNPERPRSWFFDRSRQEWQMMHKAFEKFDDLTIVAVSDWLKMRASQSPFFQEKEIRVVYNGVDTSIFHFISESNVRKQYQLQNKRILLYSTPDFNFPLKGGSYIMELAEKIDKPDICIVMVGKNLPVEVPQNVITIPYIDSKEKMAELYSIADMTLLTSKRETFSMVCAESLCCGTPVAGFEAGGPESIAIQKYSRFVSYGNVDKLWMEVQEMLSEKTSKEQISLEACKKYSTKEMVEQYLTIYQETL